MATAIPYAWNDQSDCRVTWRAFESSLRIALLSKDAAHLWDDGACTRRLGVNPLQAQDPIPVDGMTPIQLAALQQEVRRRELQRSDYGKMQEKLRTCYSSALAVLLGYFDPGCAVYRDLVAWMSEADAAQVPGVFHRVDVRWREIWNKLSDKYRPSQAISARYIREELQNHTDRGISFPEWARKFEDLCATLGDAQGHAEDDGVLRDLIGRNVQNPNLKSLKQRLFVLDGDVTKLTIVNFLGACRALVAAMPDEATGGAGTGPVIGAAAGEAGTLLCVRCGRSGHSLGRKADRCKQDKCVLCNVDISGGQYHDATNCCDKAKTMNWSIGQRAGGGGSYGGDQGAGRNKKTEWTGKKGNTGGKVRVPGKKEERAEGQPYRVGETKKEQKARMAELRTTMESLMKPLEKRLLKSARAAAVGASQQQDGDR